MSTTDPRFLAPGAAPVTVSTASALILASAIGLTVGMPATMFYSLGTFIAPLQKDFGWGRGDIAFAVTIMTIGLFLSGPITGRLCDRFGAAAVGAGSLASYATIVAIMGFTVSSLPMLWSAYFLIALAGTGSTSIALVRPIIGTFHARRGLALGLALTGAGLAAFWVPLATQAVIGAAGWRAAYLMLAATALVAAPLLWWAFRPFDRIARGPDRAVPEQGLGFVEARRTVRFWLLSGITLAMAAGVAGIVFHLVPILGDAGITPTRAAATASIVGLASMAGRLVVGLMLDRYRPAGVAGLVLLLSASGTLALAVFGTGIAWFCAILLGLAAGAEVDLLAFLTARYFGRRAYGAIYGWMYGVFALGYGFAPYVVGLSRDQRGDYVAALVWSAGLVGAAAVGMFVLARRAGAAERFARGLN